MVLSESMVSVSLSCLSYYRLAQLPCELKVSTNYLYNVTADSGQMMTTVATLVCLHCSFTCAQTDLVLPAALIQKAF